MSDIHTVVARALESVPYAQTLGVEPIFMGDEFTLRLPFSQENVGNPTLPALHGGCIGGFMELTAIAELVHLKNVSNIAVGEIGKLPKPIGINIDYLRRGRPVDTFARAVVFKKGSRVMNVRVQAWQDDYDRPIAALHGHYLISTEK